MDAECLTDCGKIDDVLPRHILLLANSNGDNRQTRGKGY
jgi:hypothetical protein